MQRDGYGDGKTQSGILQRGEERGKTLGEVVDADRERGEEAHAHELVMVGGVVVQPHFPSGRARPDATVRHRRRGVAERRRLHLGVDLVRVLGRRNQIVDQRR